MSSAIMLFGALQIRTAHLTPKHKCSIRRRPSVSPTVVHPSHHKSVTVAPITRRDADGDAMIMLQVRPGPQPVKLTARNIISIYQQDHRHRHLCSQLFLPKREYPVCAALRGEWLLQLAHLSGCCSKPCQTRGERRDDLESTDFPFSADPKSKTA